MRVSAIALFTALISVAVSGCAQNGKPEVVDQRVQTPLQAGTFEDNLRNEYKALSDWEWKQQDYPDSHYHGDRAMVIAPGVYPEPEVTEYRKLPESTIPGIKAAREVLVGALANGARDQYPQQAATAQAMFDCWLEQQEENFQPEHINLCKLKFEQAMKDMGAWPPKQVVAAAPQPKLISEYIVYFDFDKHNLRPDAIDILKQVKADSISVKPEKIYVSGNADRSGSDKYNKKLSERRAKAVANYLKKIGVPAELTTESFGESLPRKETPDGVKEAENRYSIIRFIEFRQ